MIHRTQFTVTVLSDGPLELGDGDGDADPFDLLNINYAITEGDCIGFVEQTHEMPLPGEAVRGVLIQLGNDGTFFTEEQVGEILVGTPTLDSRPRNRWQCYTDATNLAIHDAVRELEIWARSGLCLGWASLEEATRKLYEAEFVPRSLRGATDTEPRGELQSFAEKLAKDLGFDCPYDDWTAWL